MSNDTAEASKAEVMGELTDSPVDQTRRELEEEFNVQRAKMKELFLQKEEDMRKMIQEKEQLQSEVVSLREELTQLQTLSQNQRSEIENLQLLVSETLEASSSGSEEVRRLQQRNLELEHQLRQQQQQQALLCSLQEVSLAPATFVRTLARKLGGDADDQASKKQSSEEGELRSIIQPLNDEIAALKTKLRDTDTQLQEALKFAATNSPASSAPGGEKSEKLEESASGCDMCVNYEKQLVSEQARADAARERAGGLERALKLATEELEGVRSLHDETIGAWRDERAASQHQLEALRDAVEEARAALAARVAAASQHTKQALEHVTQLTVQRETLQKQLEALEQDNEMLKGSYIKKAIELQNEIINLPDNVEELQELVLVAREQLICSQLGRERAAGVERALRGDLREGARRARELHANLTALRDDLRRAREQLEESESERSQMGELGDKLRHSNDMIENLLEDKKRLQSEASELRSRVSALQQELDNSEKVQQDFVRLSQSLQVQLQRIREADTEVRWQHEEDVSECPSCHVNLPNVKKKVHCRHCGRIFCGACVAHSVASGPRGAPARVCAVCRTLLQPHTAPYFSTEPPHSPD
ncbi:rab GTPase-binding effector protein 1 isoform X2 [Amyelois transitella]|uniref:rab GTPase-binding effector protein 1 isoform X2 n=1 Tax=Amyelois transitella TaxID=680683 RepID=UPI00298FDD52|nr:rab GTPase-binding effector protein 1 isoform X2 [Amyelois transitella]